jgi:hypothetical protein
MKDESLSVDALVSQASEMPDIRVIKGRTTKPCPYCGKARRRHYDVVGPLKRSQLDPFLNKIQPRVSTRPIWKKLHLVWLVCPPDPPHEDRYYEVRIYATCTYKGCTNPGRVRVLEREGYRQFGLWGRMWICFRAFLHWGVDRIVPL